MKDAKFHAMHLRHLATAAAWTLLVVGSFVWNGFDWGRRPVPFLAWNEWLANLAVAHFGIWLAGLLGIGWAGRIERVAMRERLEADANIRQLAFSDALTGLHNRASMDSRLAQVLAMARRESIKIAVMFIDLDWFKRINDSLGHDVGDKVLQGVARRLLGVVRESDIVARQGGDEFVVVLVGLDDETDAATVAGKILDAFQQSFAVANRDLHVTPSIGIALYPQDGETSAALMKNADTALYCVKGSGRAGFLFYRQEMNAKAEWRLWLESELRVALAADDLIIHYQPKVRATDNRIHGFEALLRWQHPLHGAIPPTDFISVAEQSGLIDSIGDWVLNAVCRQLADWKQAGIDDVCVAVNVSARQLAAADLAHKVGVALERYGIVAGRLELEVTESTAIGNPEQAIERLGELRKIGVTLAIDDFGTGYSSLAYLKRLPVQTIKIDRSFVQDIGREQSDNAIVAAMLALARILGLRVVAEGVETRAQEAFLVSHGCDELQGYLFGKPAPAELWTAQLGIRDAEGFLFSPGQLQGRVPQAT
jgi:diguanylate cyclase (GGDEF)-like protein